MKGRRTIHHRGMTLIELLVVIAIVGILAAMLLPATSQALERTKRTVCQNNLRQTYLMVASHASDHGGLLPAAWVTDPGQPMRVIASRAFGEPDPKSLHCPSDRRRFEPPLFDLSYYWNAQSLGQPLASLHPQLHLATEKWFWHDRKAPKPIGESSTYQGQGVALWADGKLSLSILGRTPSPTKPKRWRNEATEAAGRYFPEQRFEERRGLGLTEPFFRAMVLPFQN